MTETPTTAMPTPLTPDHQAPQSFAFNLHGEREQRTAALEGSRQRLPLHFTRDPEPTVVLGPEFPIDALSSLRTINDDLALLLRLVVDRVRGGETADVDPLQVLITLIASNANLPTQVLNALHGVAVGLLGDEAWQTLQEQRPSAQDYAALARTVVNFYGLSLGEASTSSDSSTDGGGTSSTTSSTTSASTPEVSGLDQATPTSSASPGSPV